MDEAENRHALGLIGVRETEKKKSNYTIYKESKGGGVGEEA